MKPTELTYKVTTNNGVERTIKFTETRNKRDYGNGVYIAVDRGDGDISILDQRYVIGYSFQIACQDYIARYYREALTGFMKVEEAE